MIKVFGHLNPDTDTVGSAIIMAWYLNTFTSLKAESYVLGSLNKETQFMLNKWGVKEPELLEKIDVGDKVVVVDTNNPQELFPNINDTEILYIVDHHASVGGLKNNKPAHIYIKPLASTASVIHDLISKSDESNIPDEIAGIMLTCILSDTLAFRSPTTTPHDKDLAEKLAKKLKINIEEYSSQMFEAKSDISDFTDHGLLHLDSKKFEVGDKNFRISVCETTNPESIIKRYDGIVKSIEDIKKEDASISDVLFFVIDILKEEATVFTYNDFVKKVIATSFDVTADTKTEVLPGVVSRKKQIIPVLKLPV
jgi:manganese-dependent inorganic pyrophosphatase